MRRTAFRRLTFPVLLMALVLSASTADARYRFDDVYGDSGRGAQWVVITGNGYDTFGGAGSGSAINAYGDLVTDRNHVELENGRLTDPDFQEGRYIHTMFLVIPETSGVMTVNFGVPSTGNVTPYTSVEGIEGTYSDIDPKSKGSPIDTGNYLEPYHTKDWGQFDFTFIKKYRQTIYESVRGNFAFHQDPSYVTSQTLLVPLVVANVYNGTAAMSYNRVPLKIRVSLHDDKDYSQSNIVASRVVEWDIVSDKTVGNDKKYNDQWVFIPVDSLPTDGSAIDYYLSTEVTNHTGIRYAVQRYDSYVYNTALKPRYWKFDLPPENYGDDLPPRFYLDELSHASPGLVTVYGHTFNVNRGEKAAIRLYPVDEPGNYKTLILNHRLIFGAMRGEADSGLYNNSYRTSTKQYTAWRIQAFDPTPMANDKFLENVAKKMNAESNAKINIPTASMLSTGSVKTITGPSSEVIHAFHLDRKIPDSLTNDKDEGMLPMHITFKIPYQTPFVAKHWNELVEKWHETGDIHDLFKKYFSVYLMSPAQEDREDNPWDLVEELEKQTDMTEKDMYRDQLKLFVDDTNGVITVSFVAFMMDGTRDGVRPALGFVTDSTGSAQATDNTYMIIRDGFKDSHWKLSFFVAPTDLYKNNDNKNLSSNSSGSGGGGCTSGVALVGLALMIPMLFRKK